MCECVYIDKHDKMMDINKHIAAYTLLRPQCTTKHRPHNTIQHKRHANFILHFRTPNISYSHIQIGVYGQGSSVLNTSLMEAPTHDLNTTIYFLITLATQSQNHNQNRRLGTSYTQCIHHINTLIYSSIFLQVHSQHIPGQ